LLQQFALPVVIAAPRLAVTDSPLAVDDAVPGHAVRQLLRQVEHRVSRQPRVARQTGQQRHLAVGYHLAVGHLADNLVDQGVLLMASGIDHGSSIALDGAGAFYNTGMNELTGKHIVVTGASAGIGAELCRQLGRLGCRITMTARRRKLLGEVAEQVRRAGGEAYLETCDVTERDEVFELAEYARSQFGEIDVWVSNAGGGMRHRLLEAEEADMLLMYRLNCLSSLWAYQAVIVPWIEQRHGGQLIDVNSVGGKAGFAYAGGYCAAKHALSGMGDVLRQELARTGVTLTTVYPGLTESEFSAAVIDRTEGDQSLRTEVMSRRAPWFVRQVAAKQPTAHVARAIVNAIRRPVPFVYPHRWAALAALLYNLWPNMLLSRLNRPRRNSSRGQ